MSSYIKPKLINKASCRVKYSISSKGTGALSNAKDMAGQLQ